MNKGNRTPSRYKFHEKCAVAAATGESAALRVVESLYALQHRGSEASGIACKDKDSGMSFHRGPGLVTDVFSEDIIRCMTGGLAIGHNRYSTNGSKYSHQQPVIDENIGFAFAHNGNIPVTNKLREYLLEHNYAVDELNDSEMFGNAIAQKIRKGLDLPDAIEEVYPMAQGAFSCVAMHDGMIAAFRDAYGIRPLSYGKHGSGFAISSETCGLDIVGVDEYKDVNPGEMVVFTKKGIKQKKQLAKGTPKLDIFEFIYFARPDSILYGQRVNGVRRNFGKQLAREHSHIITNQDDTVVVPVPDTSIPSSEGFAEELKLPHHMSLIKNRYVGRTFMQPSQAKRQKHLRRKHNMMNEEIYGKDLVLIDDSIVRLNTIPRIVAQAWEAGANSVNVLIASPPVRFPDYYGIDVPSQKYLAAANLTIKEMQEKIGASYLGFLTLEGLIHSTGLHFDQFNLAMFNGEYPIDIGASNKKSIRKPVSMEYVSVKADTLPEALPV